MEKSKLLDFSIMLVFWSLVRNSVVLAVYLLFSVACFFTVHEHLIMRKINRIIRENTVDFKYVQFIGSGYRPYVPRRNTPLMGWASWNCFRTDISERKMKEQADALVATGLADCGYSYLNMDDGFFGGRDEKGRLLFHPERFPGGIKPVADYAHRLGLKAGIYSEAGDNTCGYYYDGKG